MCSRSINKYVEGEHGSWREWRMWKAQQLLEPSSSSPQGYPPRVWPHLHSSSQLNASLSNSGSAAYQPCCCHHQHCRARTGRYVRDAPNHLLPLNTLLYPPTPPPPPPPKIYPLSPSLNCSTIQTPAGILPTYTHRYVHTHINITHVCICNCGWKVDHFVQRQPLFVVCGFHIFLHDSESTYCFGTREHSQCWSLVW